MSEHGRIVTAPEAFEHLSEDEALIARAVSTPDLPECGPDCDADCVCEDE